MVSNLLQSATSARRISAALTSSGRFPLGSIALFTYNAADVYV
jgi:hypothetical protein